MKPSERGCGAKVHNVDQRIGEPMRLCAIRKDVSASFAQPVKQCAACWVYPKVAAPEVCALRCN